MTACALCGLETSEPIVVNRVARHGEPQASHACARCGLVQVVDLPTEAELAAYYSGPYRERFGVPPPGDPAELAAYAARIREYVGEHARIAEIGAGTGELARALGAALAFEADTSVQPVEGVTLDRGPWTRLGIGDELVWSVDAIVSCHVLEHMRDPLLALVEMRLHLADGGRVWLEVPSVATPYGAPDDKRVTIDACGLGWFFQRPHLFNYSPHTLALALALAGFDDIEIESRGLVLYGRARNPGGLALALAGFDDIEIESRGLVLYGRAVSHRGQDARSYDEALAICGPAEPGDVVADRLARWERQHRRMAQLTRFLDGEALGSLGDDAEIVIRHEMLRAIEGASHAIEQLSALHVALDASVSGEDAPAPSSAWHRGFAAGRAYGTQRAQVAVGLLASELVGVTQ